MLLEELDVDSICKRKPLKISPDWSQQTGKKKKLRTQQSKNVFFVLFFSSFVQVERDVGIVIVTNCHKLKVPWTGKGYTTCAPWYFRRVKEKKQNS